MYELKGNEVKEETTEKIECGEAVTTKYWNGDKLVRVDKTINVDTLFITKAISEFGYGAQ